MFVRTNASRQNYRLGRSVSRIARPSHLSSPSNYLSPLPPSPQTPSSPILRPWRGSRLSRAFPQTNRGLATAVGSHFTTTQASEPNIYELRRFDPSEAMTIKEPRRPPPTKRPNTMGITGDIEMAIPVYEACLRIGKLDRAQLILQRIEQLGGLEPERRLYLHNLYLEANVRHIRDNPGLGRAEELHAWYEMYIHGGGIPQSAETIAYMLKASLLTTASEGTRLERLINRYMGMVPPEQGLDVLYRTDILTDSDIATITHHYPEFNISTFPDDLETPIDLDVDLVSQSDPTLVEHTTPAGVLSTPQKGIGLKTVQSTLAIFDKMKDGYDISTLPPHERREFQSRLERDCIDMAMERWRETAESLQRMGLQTGFSGGSLNFVLGTWHRDLEAAFEQEFVNIKEAEVAKAPKLEADVDRCLYGPILMLSTPERLAAVSILAVLNALAVNGSEKGATLSVIINHVAKVVEEDIRLHTWTETRQNKSEKGMRKYHNKQPTEPEETTPTNNDSEICALSDTNEENSAPKLVDPTGNMGDRITYWPLTLRTKIAAVLVATLLDAAKIKVVRQDPVTMQKVESTQPAFTRCHQLKKGRKVGVVVPHPQLAEMMRKEPSGELLARHLPMVVQPQPWSRFDKGAYQESPVPLVRIKHGEQDQRLYAEAALARGDMDQILRGLDVLGKTAWRVNRPVFNVMLEAWNRGEAIAKIPPLNPDLESPPEPDATADPLVRRNWIKAVKHVQNLKSSYHSQRCYMNFQLEIARAYRDQEFFFPHNVDFRGRAYPIPTYMNHMGADHMRGLLRFSKSRELGERGLMWLKVQLANVYGYDKASLKDRETFANDNMANIIDSANNPLNGGRWWLAAEDPWQCLAACFELKAALDCPDPTKYESSLPVHQDGTCNGLQHYAALGGDTWGAAQVNLSPGDKPADVYSAVADLVKEAVDKDSQLGNPMAKAMIGKIKRKVVKQTVMTNVYGVTFAGAKKQVLKQIKALYPTIEEETGIGPGLIASYITTRIFKALSTMFKGAHDIQYWLGEIGGRVCRALTPEQILTLSNDEVEPAYGTHKAKKIQSKDDVKDCFRSSIIWTTPLRMPIVQPYRKTGNKVIHTCVQSLTLQNPDRFDPVDRRKQLQAFPPNFIHSLDASHMMLSALECHELGLDFAAVHDSFWTHAADVDVMNRVLRDAFIRIHEEDVISRLLSEFEARYEGGLYMARIAKTSDAGRAISAWRKANKKFNARDELILEKKRIDLLASEDAAERQKGEQMITPASIFAVYASESGADVESDELLNPGLGDIAEPATEAVDRADGAQGAEDEDAGDSAECDESETGSDFFDRFSSVSHFEERLSGKQTPKATPPQARTRHSDQIHVWLPLTFPKVPEKGDFNVKELRESKYFFS